MPSLLFEELPDQVSLDRQIACVRRELRLRSRVYPQRVFADKMAQLEADEEIACMRAVLRTLQELQSSRRST